MTDPSQSVLLLRLRQSKGLVVRSRAFRERRRGSLVACGEALLELALKSLVFWVFWSLSA